MPEGSSSSAAIDSHAHVFVNGLPLAPHSRHAPDYDAPLADYLALLDAHRMSHAVLVQPSFLGTDNSFLLDAIRMAPERLRGVAVIDPCCNDDELAALVRGGVRGIRLNLVGLPTPNFARGGWPQLFERVRAKHLHVELHCASRELLAAGQPVLDAGCKLVVDHFGRPDVQAGEGVSEWLLGAASHGRTWVKLSAAYRTWQEFDKDSARAAAQTLLNEFGPGRLVWGSDWPHTQHRERMDYSAAHAALADWVPDVEARRRILVDTPADLFNFLPEVSHAP